MPMIEYECPCCGGKIEFDSSTQQMKCPFCESTFDDEAIKALEDVQKQKAGDDMSWETNAGSAWGNGETDGMNVYTCKSCGGEIVATDTLGSTNCPYCDNPVVMTGKFEGALKPDIVIPFKLDKAAAKAALENHYKGKKLLPKAFRDQNHIDEIKGVYVPFWLFDANADADMTYHATKEKRWEDSQFSYKETSHYFVRRAGKIAFERVPVDGSSQMPDALMESIEPYNFKDAVDFKTSYLSGYLADKYDVDAQESIERANDRIRKSTESTFLSSVQGYDDVEPEASSIQLHNGTAKYALYPVWILNTTWNGEKYTFAMNGQTGKMVGDLPLDKGAYWKWFTGLAVLFSGIACLITYLMG